MNTTTEQAQPDNQASNDDGDAAGAANAEDKEQEENVIQSTEHGNPVVTPVDDPASVQDSSTVGAGVAEDSCPEEDIVEASSMTTAWKSQICRPPTFKMALQAPQAKTMAVVEGEGEVQTILMARVKWRSTENSRSETAVFRLYFSSVDKA